MQTIEDLRIARNIVLQKSDYLLLPDTVLTDEELVLLKMYRQMLRDLPSKYTNVTVGESTIPTINNIIINKLIS
jgi:hypothetical protein